MILDNLLRLTDADNILIPMTSTKFLLLQDFIDKSFGVPDRFEAQIHSLIMRTAASRVVITRMRRAFIWSAISRIHASRV